MHFGALLADANGRTGGERSGLPPTWLSATACDWLDYSRCQFSGQGTPDERHPLTLQTLRLVVVFLFFFAFYYVLF